MIYLHIPFCKQKCSYCNFHFSTSLQNKGKIVDAIGQEITRRHGELSSKTLETIYFGGGTPSLLSSDELNSILEHISSYFEFSKNIEITLEANPDDLSDSFLREIANSPINRLSIGTQSFFSQDLKLMNRAHDSQQAETSIKRAQDFGFDNISIDLIYGSSNLEIWQKNLEKTAELGVTHVSCYALTVEPKTALAHWIATKKIAAPKEEEQNEQFEYLCSFLQEKGFSHYEISNFAKPGYESKHNSAYWQGKEYLGVGPSAHSYDAKKRRSWNIANNTLYLKKLKENEVFQEFEILTETQQLNELLMIGLRTKKGVDISSLELFSSQIKNKLFREIQKKQKTGHLEIKDNRLTIPYEHWFLADGIASDLFQV